MFFHKELTEEKWQSLSFFEQMANIGAEIGRAINWRKKDMAMSTASLYRGIELLDATIQDKKNRKSKTSQRRHSPLCISWCRNERQRLCL